MITVMNSFSGKKELFQHDRKKAITLYVCGITPYDYAHVGHGRCYVTFDLLQRFLTFCGYEVRYARNFTDIDDKILKRAREELGDVHRYKEITQKYIAAYHEDMKLLDCVVPDVEPCVTEMIPEIIHFIEKLIEKEHAYVHQGSVYYRVASFPSYGALSKQSLDQLISGARIEIDVTKENPLDFALWKADESIGFISPWGKGRPGWHIECSVMVQHTLGDTIDIHGGGLDLLFPHHENERAQSVAVLGHEFVRYWIHNAFVRINKEKMSKSLNNFFTLRDIFKKYDPMVIRFYFLKHHYRNPLDFSYEDLDATEKAYKKLVHIFSEVEASKNALSEMVEYEVISKIVAYLSDDLNTSGAFGVLFESLPKIMDKKLLGMVKQLLQQVFGLSLQALKEEEQIITPEIADLLVQREKARAEKNWPLSDALRDKLVALGVDLHDKKIK